jgi:hypothetical protein
MRSSLREILRDIGNKQKLSTHFDDHPLLLVLLFSPWFRVVFILFLAGFLSLPLVMLRLWRTTPDGFKPIVRVSGIDVAQSWSLRRTARAQAAAGRWEDSLVSLRASLANNAANTDTVREFLATSLHAENKPKTIGLVVGQAYWLLRLTGTNVADVELSARVFDHFQCYELVEEVLAPFDKELPTPIQSLRLKAFFELGHVDAFQQLWKKIGAQLPANPELDLYRAAYQAGWGAPGEVADGRQKLEAAAANPQSRILANGLLVKVARQLLQEPAYRKALDQLDLERAGSTLDHVGYWRVLLAVGRKNDAIQLAKNYPYPPKTPLEVIRLSEFLNELGLKEETGALLRQYTPQFRGTDAIWLCYANFLLDNQQWEETRALALTIRRDSAVRDELAAFSYFLEGRAELALDRRSNAGSAFRKCLEFDFSQPRLALFVASNLNRLGFPEIAAPILMKLEKQYADSVAYWQMVFITANEMKQADLLLTASSNAFRLQPNSTVGAHNYAAALLVNHVRPEEAVRLTLDVLTSRPGSYSAMINHSLALVANHRLDDAQKLLQTIPVGRLGQEEASSFYLTRLQLEAERRQTAQLQETARRINLSDLFPAERQFVANILKTNTESGAVSEKR